MASSPTASWRAWWHRTGRGPSPPSGSRSSSPEAPTGPDDGRRWREGGRLSGRVLVGSYNIHECVGTDGRRDPVRIAEVIQALDADVIALQEVASRWGPGAEMVQMEFLAHTVGLQAISGPTIERRDGHYGNVLLTRLPVIAVRKLDLTVLRREPRGALDVDLDVE